jgi:hypothetical protein
MRRFGLLIAWLALLRTREVVERVAGFVSAPAD